MAAEEDLGVLCNALDTVLTEFFAALQELEDLRRSYDTVARDGYFCLTKARYAMGVQAVSRLQYDSTMQALVHVHERDHAPSEQEDGCVTLRSFHAEHEHSSGRRTKAVVTQGGLREGATDADTVLRQRKHPGVEDVVRGGKPGEAEVEEDREKGSHKDPLMWFGILVPDHLRKCQQDFIKATSLACDMASVQARLLHLKQQYRRLLLQKKQLCGDKGEGTASKTEESP